MPNTSHDFFPPIQTRHWLFLCVFLAISLCSKLIFISTTSPVIAHDEIIYAADAKAISLSGLDLSGRWSPLSLQPAHVLYAELPATVMAPGMWLPGHPLLKARAVLTVLGTLFAVVLAGVSWQLFRKPSVFWTVLILTTVNPWVFQFSRMNFDALMSLFFYFVGIWWMLGRRKWQIMWALAPLTLGFFQYQGLKIIFLPLVVTTLGYLLWPELSALFVARHKSKDRGKALTILWASHKGTLALGLCCLILFGWYAWRLPRLSAGNRLNDLLFFQTSQLQAQVNADRRISLTSGVSTLASNKFTTLLSEMMKRYVQAFNPGLLFVYGEPLRNPFSVWTVGMFYTFDAVLVLIGAFWIYHVPKYRRAATWVFLLILAAPLPVAINAIDAWIMFRASLVVPLMLILAGLGMSVVWRKSAFLRAILIVLYVIQVSWFGYQYFVRFPIFSTKGQYFAERVMSSYLTRLHAKYPKKSAQVLGSESLFLFESYAYWANQITPSNLSSLHTALQTEKFILGFTEFKTDCVDPAFIGEPAKKTSDDALSRPGNVVVSDAGNVWCQNYQPPATLRTTAIPSLLDSGAIFKIFNDPLCTQYDLNRHVYVHERRLLEVEQLSDEEFCRSFVIYP